MDSNILKLAKIALNASIVDNAVFEAYNKPVDDTLSTSLFKQALTSLISEVMSDPETKNGKLGLVKKYIPELDVTVVSSYWQIYAKSNHGAIGAEVQPKSQITKFAKFGILYPISIPGASLSEVSDQELDRIAQDLTNRYHGYTAYAQKKFKPINRL